MSSAIEASRGKGISHVRLYLRVFLSLLVLTVIEYLYARFFSHSHLWILVGGLVALALIKASLVGMFFMHLAFEGRWKYLILLPTLFLATVVVLGIFPDMAFPLSQDSGVEAPTRGTPSPMPPP